MQKLQCELCGSIDILRTDDGFFQCQHCGCKYTLEQAKSLLGIVAETTIGDTELNRRVENAKAQMKIGQPAEETIRSIIVDFPASWKGYFLFIENLSMKINKDLENAFIHCHNDINLGRQYYDSLLVIANESNEISEQEVNDLWHGITEKLYNGLINGEISVEYHSEYSRMPIFKESNCEIVEEVQKAVQIGYNNKKMLEKYNIGIRGFDFHDNRESFLAYGLNNDWGVKNIECYAGHCLLGKEANDIYYFPFKPVIINEKNIGKIVEFAKSNIRNFILETNRCPRCSEKVKKTLIGNSYKCTNERCSNVYKLSDLM